MQFIKLPLGSKSEIPIEHVKMSNIITEIEMFTARYKKKEILVSIVRFLIHDYFTGVNFNVTHQLKLHHKSMHN